MPCLCFGSKSAALRQETEELEEEQARLQGEEARLQKSIEQSESTRRQVEQEIQQAAVRADESEELARTAEQERQRLMEEIAEATAPPTRSTPVFETLSGEILAVPPPPDEAPARDSQSAKESWLEAEQLMRKIAELRSELEESRTAAESPSSALRGVRACAAESAAAELRVELAERRAALAAAEDEGQRLTEEHEALLQQEAPLNDWVQHVEHELSLARDEHSELSQALTRASNERADLRRDELSAVPLRQVGIDATQVGWLQEKERENIARKAALLEEIAAHRGRRTELLAKASAYRQEARVHEEEMMTARTDRTQLFIPGAYPVSRTSYSGAHSAAPVLGISLQPEKRRSLVKSSPKAHAGNAVASPGNAVASPGGQAGNMLKHYDMGQPQSRQVPDAQSSLQFSPPSPLARLKATRRLPPTPQFAVEDADTDRQFLLSNQPLLLPSLPSRSDSGQEDMAGPANYWDSLDEDEGATPQ